jgi:hypothetical protein
MRHLMIAASVLTLAGCGGSPEVSLKNASVEDVAKAAAAGGSGIGMSPGRWEAKVSIDGIEMPGMPAGMAEQMKGQMGQGRTFASCLTPEQAKRPQGDFFQGEKSPDCRYDRFEMGNGTIDGVMTCTIGGMTQTTSMKGSFGPDSYRMTAESSGAGKAGTKVAMTIEAKRTGACRGDEL